MGRKLTSVRRNPGPSPAVPADSNGKIGASCGFLGGTMPDTLCLSPAIFFRPERLEQNHEADHSPGFRTQKVTLAPLTKWVVGQFEKTTQNLHSAGVLSGTRAEPEGSARPRERGIAETPMTLSGRSVHH